MPPMKRSLNTICNDYLLGRGRLGAGRRVYGREDDRFNLGLVNFEVPTGYSSGEVQWVVGCMSLTLQSETEMIIN